ncbi:MAG: regulatory protein RecX [Candidatus Puniceispirillaceae bacterium]
MTETRNTIDAVAGDRPRAEQRLMNKAVHYLGRYTSSRQRLREVLQRFARRKLEHFEPSEISRAIDAVITDCVRLGYVDDAAFAMTRARTKRRGGRSALAIRRSLAEHDIEDSLVDAALDAADETSADGELAAALRHAARRRIGPYARVTPDDVMKRRHLASLARAGFSFDIARQVMGCEDAADADALADSLHDETS